MDGFIFIGDYDNESHDDATITAAGIGALMNAVSAEGYYTTLNHENTILVQGNHDAKDSRMDDGGRDFGGYAVYTMHEGGAGAFDAYPEKGAGEDRVKSLAENMDTWLSTLYNEGYDKPIFIASHLPLVYSARTSVNQDGIYAKYIVDVLNKYGELGMNIFFLYGHNHAYGYDSYLGGNAIYLKRGSEALIPEAGSKIIPNEKTKLYFTYLNAGYVGYYSNTYDAEAQSSGTDELTMTVFEITGSQVVIKRYNHQGLYNMKVAGNTDGAYTVEKGLADYVDSTATASPVTVALTSLSSGTTPDTPSASVGDWVEVGTVAGTDGTEGYTRYLYTLDTDGVNAGEQYLIVGSGNAYAMTNNGNSLSAASVDLTTVNANYDTATYSDAFGPEWTITADGKIKNGTYWLVFTGSGTWQATASVSLSTNESEATSWDITDNGSGSYAISKTFEYGNYITRTATGYLHFNDNSFSATTDESTVRLYGGRTEDIVAGTPGTNAVTYHAQLTDKSQTSYTFKSDISEDQAKASILSGVAIAYSIDGGTSEATTDPGYAKTVEFPDGYATGHQTANILVNGKVVGTVVVYVQVDASNDGAASGWTQISSSSSDAAGYKYELDTDGIDYGSDNKYIIVASDAAYALTPSGGAESITIDGTTATTTDRDNDFYFYDHATYGDIITNNGTDALYQQSNGIHLGYREGGLLNGFTQYNNGLYRIYDTQGTNWTMYYNNGWTVADNTSLRVRLYKYVSEVKAEDLYAKAEGTWNFTYPANTETIASILADIKEAVTGYTSASVEGSNPTELDDSALTWTWVNIVDPAVEGNYKLTVSYQGKTLGTANVYIQEKLIASVEFPTEGTVEQGAKADADTGAEIKVTYKDNTSVSIPLTVGMISNASTTTVGTYDGLTIEYGDYTTTEFTLHVNARYVNNYPEYPNEGAVKVNKSGTGIDFQSSGIAQIELSASGVPSSKGVDVIVMLDTSSSMDKAIYSDTSKTRLSVLNDAMGDLVDKLKSNGPNGQQLDIHLAIADFNGFFGDAVDNTTHKSGTPYDRDDNDTLTDDVDYAAVSHEEIFTGGKTLNDAFVDLVNEEYNWTNLTADQTVSGTNYDYAFDAIYQMAYAKRQADAAAGNEERDLFVIFMSDGAAMQWNYYHSNGAEADWQYWITGAWSANELEAQLNCDTHKYYYNTQDTNGDGKLNEHRMANAIKGSPDTYYKVIRKSDAGLAGVLVETTEDENPSGDDNMYLLPGLGAKMFSISFDCQKDNKTPQEPMLQSIESLASPQVGTTNYYYNVTTADGLKEAFNVIGSEIAFAASNAVFRDQMGEDYNLQLKTATYEVKNDNGTTTTKTLAPKIEVIEYDIFTRDEWVAAGSNPDTMNTIGTRQNTGTVKETVEFATDGSEAYSDQIGNKATNILATEDEYEYVLDTKGNYVPTEDETGYREATESDTGDRYSRYLTTAKGMIYAKYFLYNTNSTPITIYINPGTDQEMEITVEAESFYWNLDTVTTTEQALRYYVYLDGSMEGTKEAGSYATNTSAVLYYDNYLGNACQLPTVSPVMAWKSATVSYAFYLVDSNGNVLLNQTTGQTGSFANRIAVTNPVVAQEVLLNNDGTISAPMIVASDDVLPEGYVLYDHAAGYTVEIGSNGTGSWEIVKADGITKDTTYVTGMYGSEYSNATSSSTAVDPNYVYSNTTVWFAVLWAPQALPDTVVIDYGLPVDIHVLNNDMFGENGKLIGVATYADTHADYVEDKNTAGAEKLFGTTEAKGSYGTATSDTTTGVVRYTPTEMNMPGKDVFTYMVEYKTSANTLPYYYDTVTIIPATTIYYEDSFLTYESYTWNNGWQKQENHAWTQEGNTVDDATQGEDRPGQYSLPEVDANNIYGYDSAYANMTTYSLGSAAKVHVDYDNYSSASFTFTGTGFDVIAMTTDTTGTIIVQVNDKDGNSVRSHVVDTYYGYTYTEGSGWTAVPNTAGKQETALYQVPVMQIEDLPYGQYNVIINVQYSGIFDHGQYEGSASANTGSYDFYLDAIRIYDPANDGADDKVIENAYVADKEGWPEYHELRNLLIKADAFTGDDTSTAENEGIANGIVYIDGKDNASMAEYTSYGPNNELYLTKNSAVAFKLGLSKEARANVADIQIGIKSADGRQVQIKAWNVYSDGTTANEGQPVFNTSTDMYYSMIRQVPYTLNEDGTYNEPVIVLQNVGEGIMSITNIKITYKTNPNTTSSTSEEAISLASFALTYEEANLAVMSLSLDEEIPEETQPETTIPEETQPETTIPEETQPETTVPAETEPETTVPEETEPETTVPAETEPVETEPAPVVEAVNKFVNTIVNSFKKFFSKWF